MEDVHNVDPRWEPYDRRRHDGYAQVTLVHPDPDQSTGWLCPGCAQNTVVFYGEGPRFDPHRRRYVGPDERICRSCFEQSHIEGEEAA